jgi:uncharacterized membrane protein YraQ (UPF0718 family)/copper chaperone CopZ
VQINKSGKMKEIFELVNEMSPYLLLGFLLAGIMHVFVPSVLYSRYLSAGDFRSVLYAALFGIPLPLCSCGTIPTAMSLHREGASKGATVSFLIATPQTGVDSIIATYSLMGLPFAILRPVAALFTAVFGGILVNKFDSSHKTKNSVCNNEGCLKQDFQGIMKRGWKKNFIGVIKYAFFDMMQDIGKWLVIGLVVAGLITAFVPESFFETFKGNTFLSIGLVLLFAIPMYLCATGSIPIAIALMLKGLSPGAALVLLMAGPASNVASMLVVGKVLGRKTMLLYLLSIIGGATAFALVIDYLLPAECFITPLKQIHSCCSDGSSAFNIGATIVLGLLLINALIRRFIGTSSNNEPLSETVQESGDFDSKTNMAVYHVAGMSCNHCKMNVEKAINQLPGVEYVEVDLPSAKATVTGDVSSEDVRSAIESLGFKVEIMR